MEASAVSTPKLLLLLCKMCRSQAKALANSTALASILALLKDTCEACRERGCSILQGLLRLASDKPPFLEALLPALEERIGCTPCPETSEEVRLQMAGLLAQSLASSQTISQCQLESLARMICNMWEEKSPESRQVRLCAGRGRSQEQLQVGYFGTSCGPSSREPCAGSLHGNCRVGSPCVSRRPADTPRSSAGCSHGQFSPRPLTDPHLVRPSNRRAGLAGARLCYTSHVPATYVQSTAHLTAEGDSANGLFVVAFKVSLETFGKIRAPCCPGR